MASDSSNSPNDEQTHSVQELTRGLARELSLRPNAAPGTSTPGSSRGSLVEVLRALSSCPRNVGRAGSVGRGISPGLRGGRGVSPCQSASSDSSGGGQFSQTERRNQGTICSINSVPHAGTAGPPFGRGKPCSNHAQSRVIGDAGGAELAPTSTVCTNTGVGRGRNGLPISGTISKGGKKKRIRPSTKPKTTIVHTTPEGFRLLVQELTGWLAAKLLRPEPERPQPERPELDPLQADAAPVVADVVADQPARPSSSTSRIGSVPSTPPTVSNRVPEPAFSIGDSALSSCKASLNYFMGYEQCAFPFPHQQEQLPEDSGIPDDYYKPASEPRYSYCRGPVTPYSSHEAGANAASPAKSSFQEAHTAAPLVSENDKREDGPREHASLGSPMAADFILPHPSELFAPRNPPGAVSQEWTDFENSMDCDNWPEFRYQQLVDSWISGPQ